MAGPLFMPAMQGTFGDWTYYSALVPLNDIVERVGYASVLAENTSLGAQIQRRLDDRSRASDIADYLVKSNDRFFNSLVVGVLGGQPEWHPFTLSRPSRPEAAILANSQNVVGTLRGGLTREVPDRDIAFQFEERFNEYGYFEFGHGRSMEPELRRH